MMSSIISELLAFSAFSKIKNDSFGIVLKDLPTFSYKSFLDTLYLKSKEEDVEIPYIFFIGFNNKEENILKEEIKDHLYRFKIYFTVEDAEFFRNNKHLNITKIVIVKRDVPKLSSLKWYDRIELKELYNNLCKRAEKEFSIHNKALSNLWKAFNHNSIREIISLDRLVDYYQYFVANDEDITFNSVLQFYRLGLLVDEQLFEGNINSIENIRKRLIENKRTVIRLSELDKGDQRALQSSDIDHAEKIRSKVLVFYKTRDNTILKDLKYHEVTELLNKVNSKKKKKVKDNNNKTSKKENYKKPRTPESVGVDLIIDHNFDELNAILTQVEEKYKEWEKGEKENITIESDGLYTKINFIPEIYNLIDAFVGESYGGIIFSSEKSPVDALNLINKNTIHSFDHRFINEIKDTLDLFTEEFNEAIELAESFNNFIELRNQLIKDAHRLADSPIIKIAESEKTIKQFIDYIEIYSKFMKRLKEVFSNFSSFSSKGTKELVAKIFSIDMIYVVGNKQYHAIMSPLNPLYLWKFIELTRRLTETSSNLNEVDKEFLIRTSEEIPNPLSTVFVSNYLTNNGDVVIPEIGMLGKLPIYSSEQQVNQAEDGILTIEQIIKKFINLYPHSSFGLRVAFVNPSNISSILNIFGEILSDKLSGAHIEFFKTKQTSQNWSSLEKIDEKNIDKYGITYSNNFSLKIHQNELDYKGLNKIFERTPFHLVVIFDPSRKSISESKRESGINLKIHPLVIPKIFDYDPITDKLEIKPSSEGNIFSDHHDLVARLNDKPRGWHNTIVSDIQTKKEELDNIMNNSEWLVIADSNLKNLEITVIGKEKCIYYKGNSYRDVGIYTKNRSKLINGIDRTIRDIGNYIPKQECLEEVLMEIQGLNERGILNLFSVKNNEIFNESHGKGAIGTAISSYWYKKESKKNNYQVLLVSLDTDLARNWLREREDNIYSDLVGIKKLNDQEAEIDIIEVKTYMAYSIKDNEISGEAVNQVQSVYDIVREIFEEKDRITSSSRREILRFQVFRALHQLNLTKSQKREWTVYLNDLFAGNINVNIHLYIHHVSFNDQGKTNNLGVVYHAEREITLVNIKGDLINEFFNDCGATDKSDLKIQNNEILKMSNMEHNRKMNVGIESCSISDQIEEKENETNVTKIVEDTEGKSLNLEIIDQYDIKEHDKDVVVNYFESNKIYKDIRNNKELYDFVNNTAKSLYRAMKDYSIDVLEVDPEKALVASRFVRFRVRLRPGEKLQKVLRVRSDLSREIEAESDILMDNEKGTYYIFVDVPRKSSETINLLDYIDHIPRDKIGNLNVILGQDPTGNIEIMNIAKAPHILTAGSTGSGKTIYLYSILVSLISQYNSNELELVIIDPKQTDFIYFEGLPHLRNGKIIIEAEEAVEVLTDLVENELADRTKLLRDSRNRDLFTYNEKNTDNPLKPILVIIDEYADLVSVSDLEGRKEEFERNMIRLAQRSRNVGIHLVIATQRPSADIVTSRLKANIPTRISFSLPANQDSRTILDASGAEDLLGKGDMLYSFNGELKRLQGLFIDEIDLGEYLLRNFNL